MILWVKHKLPKGLKLFLNRTGQNLWQSVVYRMVCSKPEKIKKLKHIVFVCTGNICRSAFAEHAFRAMLNDSDVKIESCGINVDKEICSPSKAIQSGLMFNVDLSVHRSKRIDQCDLLSADLIVPMDYGHYKYLASNFPNYKNKIILLREFSEFPNNIFINIDDPFGMDIREFYRCFLLIKKRLYYISQLTK